MTHLNAPTVTFSTDSPVTSRAGEDESDENGSSSSSGSNGSAGEYEFQARRTLYLMTGGNIPISSTLFELMPSAMMATDFRFTRLSLTARLRWKKDGIAGSRISSRRCAERQPVGRIPRVLSRICLRLSRKRRYPWQSSGSHEIFAGYAMKLDLGEKTAISRKASDLCKQRHTA